MSESLDAYLEALKGALAGSDRALVQDALFDARNRLNQELARLSWEEPLLTSDQALGKAVTLLGSPEQAAEGYRQRETQDIIVIKFNLCFDFKYRFAIKYSNIITQTLLRKLDLFLKQYNLEVKQLKGT